MGLTDKELIAENTAYVLGMYDMYGNDQEIVDMLKMKGLNDFVVHGVLAEIRKPAYEKRVKQAKIMIGIGLALLLGFVVLPFLVIQFSNSGATVQSPQSDIVVVNGRGEGAIIGLFKFLIRIGIYVSLLGIGQLALGTYSLFKYKKLLRAI